MLATVTICSGFNSASVNLKAVATVDHNSTEAKPKLNARFSFILKLSYPCFSLV
ncbi:Uncharacterised protein [Vibrio cholerae]|uniref:Uncharacterized protein n=1 Tax=Vibrio cholerae TaxID=666 RepID=A0A655Z2X6_VIBCL|nr:Uncharacterised protein [Vibrio cholerae]CSA82205.1 Uncharacterised protein [Vibrio cholerae]CSB10556.1 Uncharacterised protein [Vibrio cholerae]CSB93276.1 Uncharacterised protein [Vibrio cholerae]CSC56449.1 Uncharacterised protein [Vibrio cholerae]